MVLATERTLKELGDKAPVRPANDSVEGGHQPTSSPPWRGMTRRASRRPPRSLQQASYKLSEMLYQQAGAGGAEGASGNGFHGGETPEGAEQTGKPAEDVIDAEFKSE